ncbi:glycosyltransferase family 2 protein [Weissella soli]|uniref:glycosyltransferase family 2 protein n=2 Tax=Weissella soli TaxID=155866 RepID=UPI00359FA0AD
METLSVIVPVYNEEESIAIFYDALEKVHQQLATYRFEYWFIDDGSTDRTIPEIQALQTKSDAVHYVKFSRNFGKEAGLYAGLQHATGEYVVVMDVDLQDPPELLPEMLTGVAAGEWDAIGTRRTNRDNEPKIRSWFSDLFYKLINRISDLNLVNGARDYRVMSRKMVDAILEMTEYNRFSKGIFNWVGFRQKYLEFKHVERVAGTTSWSFNRLVGYAIEGMVAFSQVPLTIISFLGVISFFASLLAGACVVIRAIFNSGAAIDGWASLVVIILFMGGIQLLSLGIVGRYISAIYLETKKRPIYIASEVK